MDFEGCNHGTSYTTGMNQVQAERRQQSKSAVIQEQQQDRETQLCSETQVCFLKRRNADHATKHTKHKQKQQHIICFMMLNHAFFHNQGRTSMQ